MTTHQNAEEHGDAAEPTAYEQPVVEDLEAADGPALTAALASTDQ